ncbi:uncharacterized protein LOC132282132 [Cornus florida]|uniref:uncharacterized protein LOC132282132 n=1 Tax=Cornus florida TaxID=4283 RepID=UPI00289D606F|nr:uncharacterized protein LOC132282132 [Cornus florida]
MEWSSTPRGCGMVMLDQAKEELQILEAQHPNKFGYLKLELKSFIFLLESQNLNANSNSLPTSSTATTQVSSTSRKRKKSTSDIQRVMEGDIEAPKLKFHKCHNLDERDRVDVVIEKAQACLYKIQQFKTNFCFIDTTH